MASYSGITSHERLMQKFCSGSDRRVKWRRSAELDLHIIQHAFAEHMRALGYATLTIGWYQRRRKKISAGLCRRGRRLTDVRLDEVVTLVARLARRCPHARKMNRAALHCWLRFRGLKLESTTRQVPGPWRHWLDRYESFLAEDCGLALNTRVYRRRHARLYLAAQFRSGRCVGRGFGRVTSGAMLNGFVAVFARVRPT
jgi:hypothetical protein